MIGYTLVEFKLALLYFKEQTENSIIILCTWHIALWVKSGNRRNLKCWQVNDHSALIFHRKVIIPFLNDAKLQNVYDWFLGLIIYVKYLRSYLQKNMKGGSEKSEILSVGQLACAEKK